MRSNMNITALSLCLLAAINSALAIGPSAVNLHTAGNFAILSKTGVSTVPPSVVTGNVGVVSPTDATGLTGFSLTLDSTETFSTSTQVVGELFAASYKSPTPSQLTTAISDLQAAFTDATNRVSPILNLASGNISGLVIPAGLYKWTTGVSVASSITVSGSSTDTWIFQTSGALLFGSGARVILLGGAQASNIVWAVSGSVTLSSTSHLEGVVLGKTSITVQTGASVNGRLLSQANVALQKATIVG